MTGAVLEVGDKVHIITPRSFREDLRRHFAGAITAVSLPIIRAEGYAFIVNPISLEARKLPGRRTRVFGLLDAGQIINVLPGDVEIDNLAYVLKAGTLIMADGRKFSLEVNEYKQ